MLRWRPVYAISILRSICDCNAHCWKVACAQAVTHTHSYTHEYVEPPSVQSAISRSTSQLGPSLSPPAPTTITPLGASGGYMEGIAGVF